MPMSLGTRAQELALYVVFESPLEMVSDYPEQYKGQKDFDFIKQVPATWDEVRVIDGLPMRYITLARRSGKDWYVGSLTNWEERNTRVPLNFLGEGKYVAEIYADAPDAASNATHTTFSKRAGRSHHGSRRTHGFRRRQRHLDPSGQAMRRKAIVTGGTTGIGFGIANRDGRSRLRCNRDRADR